MSPIVERLTPPITSLMKLLTSGTCDHRLLWGTVCVVLDGVQELLESPGGVALGAAGMIGAACNHEIVCLYTMYPGHAGLVPSSLGARLGCRWSKLQICLHYVHHTQCNLGTVMRCPTSPSLNTLQVATWGSC